MNYTGIFSKEKASAVSFHITQDKRMRGGDDVA